MKHELRLMAQSLQVSRIRGGAIALGISGLLFLAFPLIRPFSDSSADPSVVAATFASTSWVLAHSLDTVGFVLLPLGFYALHICVQESRVERRAFQGLILTMLGSGLTLPFFGAEAFSLQVIGQQALAQHSSDVLSVANSVRFGPAIGFIIVGLLLVGVGAILSGSAVWTSGIVPKWSGILLAFGFGLYIPQLSIFASNQPIRVADGLVIAAGCIWLARGMWRDRALNVSTKQR